MFKRCIVLDASSILLGDTCSKHHVRESGNPSPFKKLKESNLILYNFLHEEKRAKSLS